MKYSYTFEEKLKHIFIDLEESELENNFLKGEESIVRRKDVVIKRRI
ncbi:hypothetical protein [Priestia endophytica]|nr:hypothetical protein [Priestia endophytica]MCM3537765.1 hypothetical protein [Priestia endophytica]